MQGPKPHAHKPSRNHKKKHHATHEARNNNHLHRQQQQASAASNPNAGASATYVACKLCKQELTELEKEFYPCNCKYKVRPGSPARPSSPRSPPTTRPRIPEPTPASATPVLACAAAVRPLAAS